MIDPLLQSQATRFNEDTLSENEQGVFAKALAINPDLIMHTVSLAEDSPLDFEVLVMPPETLRNTLCEQLFPPLKVEYLLANAPDRNSRALVVADNDGVIEWVSPSFTRMCGYSLAELRGNKAGKILQGPETDPAAVEVLRTGLRENREVTTHIANYHKNGDRYDVEIQLSPVHGEAGELVGYIAVENQL